MELTIDQALQQGIAAHKEGKVQDAERLYRAILQSQPFHPDANHNLGVLAVSVGKADAALPLFKTALEANSKIEQYWLSYIDALIKEKQFDNAKEVLEQAKNQGVAGEKINVLEAQLTPTAQVNQPKLAVQKKSLSFSEKRKKLAEQKKRKKKVTKQNLKANNPSQQQLSSLLEHYQNGRYNDAEKSARFLALQYPSDNFSWKILGAVLKATDRPSEAEFAGKKAVEITPDDAEAHYNLGSTLKELGKLDEAEASYTQAIALKPDFAEAHYNLGVMLQELGRLDEAEASYKQAIALKPDHTKAHSNLGNTLKELGRLDEAEASYKQTISMKPDDAEAHYNLGILWFECKKYNLAAERFELCDTHQSKLYAIQCSYLQDEETVFYEKFDVLVNQVETNAVLGSLGFRSEFKYGIKKSNSFCNDPLKYVVKTDLNALYDFEKIFIETARAFLTDDSVSYKAQGHLTNGIQTAGDIFSQGKVPKTDIESIIHAEIEKYRIQFKDSEEGFIKSWPTSYEIKGWLVCMQSGGKLAPHMHDTGWITGSIYINVPPKSETDSGNLVLCLSDQDHVLGVEKSQQSIIDVVTGSLCLFPSSLHHYTVPFEEKEERIVLAFDVIPK
ncbi:tetratricopeptide repeat protein [Gammaproteobacteria bacterium]|nr:tetratricopeptide repeat protein [Gammaproteobacteria bacterium]